MKNSFKYTLISLVLSFVFLLDNSHARIVDTIEALENKHKELRAQFDMVMAEIDEYDQNY